MDIEVRPIDESEVTAFRTALSRGFGYDLTEKTHERFKAVMPLSRTAAAFDGESVVGTLGDYPFDVTVPGGAALPMAGTTMVTVQPTHRRRGILTALLRLHLDTAVERGDPLAGLWASETAIYGRFGFGCAADRHRIELDANAVTLPAGAEDVEVRLVDVDGAKKLIPEVYEAARTTRAGMLSRNDAWWEHRYFHDPRDDREGKTAHRHAVAMRAGSPVGYAVYRQKEDWGDWVAKGEVTVTEVIALDEDVRRTLWSFLTHIDLYPKVSWWDTPVDYPTVLEASNRRLVQRTVNDTLWIRLLDLPRALEGRRYESDGRIVLDVADGFLPANQGVYEVAVDGGEATCRPTTDAADVAIGVDDLGALYLGGRNATQLAAAGRVTGSPEAVLRLNRLFATAVAPWCPEVF